MLNYSRRTWAEIDLDALEHNYKTACALAKGAAVMPVIKADAYGHGAPYIARCLERLGAAYFAVSNLDEAKQLRNEGCRAHILILGYTPPADFPQLFSLRLTQTVMTLDYASALSAAALTCGTQACVHIKADTGMGRLGLDARRSSSLDGAVDAIRQICAMPGLQCEGLYTHFAVSDIPEEPYTAAQLSLFQSLLDRLAQAGISIPLRHASNSGGILNYPGARLDMVRQGISLYGMYPDSRCRDIGLKPVMRLVTIVTQVHPLRMGESVSYGRTYRQACRRARGRLCRRLSAPSLQPCICNHMRPPLSSARPGLHGSDDSGRNRRFRCKSRGPGRAVRRRTGRADCGRPCGFNRNDSL